MTAATMTIQPLPEEIVTAAHRADALHKVLHEVLADVLSVVTSTRWSFTGLGAVNVDALVRHVETCTVKCDYEARSRAAGKADRGRHQITLNMRLLDTPERLRSTALHEWAHILQFHLAPRSRSHGHEWKLIAKLLGHSGARCHSYDVAAAYPERYVHYVCPCRKVFHLTKRMHNIIQGGSARMCGKCRGKLVKAA